MAGALMRLAYPSTTARSPSGRWLRSASIEARNTSRRRPRSPSPTRRGSRPRRTSAATASRAAPVSRSARASTRASTDSMPSATPPPAATRSRAESVSRAEPAPSRSTCWRASSVTSRPASPTTQVRCSASSSASSRPKGRCWVRLLMVGSTFCGSVVARMNTTWPGGSSRVFNNALDAAVESMCTSSRMYTLVRPGVPMAARLMSSRTASTPLLEAASSSWTSIDVPASMARQDSHSPQGSPSVTLVQLRALARMRAVEVLPVPRGPLKR